MPKNKIALPNLIRCAVRGPASIFWTALLHENLIRIPQTIVGWYRPMWVIHKWGWGFGKIMGIRIHKRNERHGDFGDVIIANHMGFLDIPILLTFFPSVFIIRSDMRKVPYFGSGLAEQGHIFVSRGDKNSARDAAKQLVELLEDGDRVIVFPEGGASPGADRKPFKPRSFTEAQRLGKKVELCIIDYLPDRRQLQWDASKRMLPQMIELFGRRRSDVSVEFFPAEEVVGDPEEFAKRYHDLVEQRLQDYDREREEKEKGR